MNTTEWTASRIWKQRQTPQRFEITKPSTHSRREPKRYFWAFTIISGIQNVERFRQNYTPLTAFLRRTCTRRDKSARWILQWWEYSGLIVKRAPRLDCRVMEPPPIFLPMIACSCVPSSGPQLHGHPGRNLASGEVLTAAEWVGVNI